MKSDSNKTHEKQNSVFKNVINAVGITVKTKTEVCFAPNENRVLFCSKPILRKETESTIRIENRIEKQN